MLILSGISTCVILCHVNKESLGEDLFEHSRIIRSQKNETNIFIEVENGGAFSSPRKPV